MIIEKIVFFLFYCIGTFFVLNTITFKYVAQEFVGAVFNNSTELIKIVIEFVEEIGLPVEPAPYSVHKPAQGLLVEHFRRYVCS